MSRPLCFVLGFALLAAPPARGQDLLEAFVEGFVDGMNDAANDNNNGYNNNGYNHNHNHNGYNNYQPNYPGTHYHKVWDGDHWDYVPHSNNAVYPNGNVVYPSNNVVYPNATVVSPATTISTAVSTNALPYKGPGVTIALEEEVGGSVNYMIDGKESATIQAGQQQTLPNKGKYEIRFSRGKSDDGRNFGEARYTITEGNYHFTVTDKGWELLRDKEQPNIVTAPIQSASPSGIKTNALPPKTAPVAGPQAGSWASPAAAPSVPAAPAANAVPAANTVPAAALAPGVSVAPAANAIPAANATPAANAAPAAPAAAPAVPAAPAATAVPAANTAPAPAAPAPAAG